ncbi:MAG: putative peptide zinc metalloprotease protein [Acidimicrobiaceae bacterium]
MRRVAVSVATCLVALGLLTGGAYADDRGSGPTNKVFVQNTSDGATRVKAKAMVAEDRGPTVAPENAATAYASCTDCRTVAVAVQVVIVVGPASDSRPTNSAIAVNYQCLRCQTFAYANQVLVNAADEVELSDAAERRLGELRQEIARVASSSETFDQMSADLDGLTQQMVTVVQDEVNRAGAGSDRHDERDVEQAA